MPYKKLFLIDVFISFEDFKNFYLVLRRRPLNG